MTFSLNNKLDLSSAQSNSFFFSTYKKKNSLVLDLDETLIHTRLNKFHEACIEVPVLTFDKMTMLYVLPRPGVQEFLDTMKNHYTLYIYTASDKQYAEAILTKLGLVDYFEKVYNRGYCYSSEGKGFMKDLQLLNLPLKRLVFVDDAEKHTTQNTLNGLQIKPFRGDLKDKELLLLTPFLQEIASASDVRPVHTNFENYSKKRYTFSFAEINSADSMVATGLPQSKPKIFLKGIHRHQNSMNQSLDKSDSKIMKTFQKKLIPLIVLKKKNALSVVSLQKDDASEDSPTLDLADFDERVFQQNILVKQMTISHKSQTA